MGNGKFGVVTLYSDIVSLYFINESKWIKGKFSWQEGYGAFSYSKSHLDNVVKYILNQEEHHKNKKFKDEYLEFLEKFEIEYKDEYLFDWIDWFG